MNTDVLNRLGEGFCGFSLGMLIQSGILVMALFVLDRLLRNHIRCSLRYAIWLLVLVKLILPPQLAAPTGVGYWFKWNAPAQVATTDSGIWRATTEKMPPQTAAFNEHALTPAPEAKANSPEVQSVRTAISWQAVAFCAWLAGLAILLAAFAWRTIAMARLVSRSRPASNTELELLAECAADIAHKGRVRLLVSSDVHSPAVCGLLRPVILLPESIIVRLSRQQLSTVLLHELSHIRRGDLWVHLAQVLLQIFYFYNPLVWLANSHIRRLRELANDEQVLVHLHGRRDYYTTALLEVAEVAFAGPNRALGFLGVVENRTRLKERITYMINKPIPAYSKVGLWGFAAIAILGCILLPMASAAETQTAIPKLTQEQFLTQAKLTYDRQRQAYAAGNTADALADFADDAITLAPTVDLLPNKAAIFAIFDKQMSNGNKYPGANMVYQDIYVSGKYVFAVRRSTTAIRVRSMPQVLVEYSKGLDVLEVQPDGSLKTKVYGYTYDAVPDGVPAFSKEPISAADGSFHVAPGDGQPASKETIEQVRQAYKDCIAAYLKSDAQATASFFADNAVMLPPMGSMFRGRDQISADFVQDLKRYEYQMVSDDVVAIEGTEQMVFTVAKSTVKMKDLKSDASKGDNVYTVAGKTAFVWQKQTDGSWKILMFLVSTN